MDATTSAFFESIRLFDEKTNSKTARQNKAYIALNNLYLAVERKTTKMSVKVGNDLRTLVCKAYDTDDATLQSYWQEEFIKLPNWNNF